MTHRNDASSGNLFHVKALFETIHTAAGINQLLLASIEGMALGADIHLHLLLGGTGFKRFTAYAANYALPILGMNVFLHCCFTSFAYAMAGKPQVIIYHIQLLFATVFYVFPAFSPCFLAPKYVDKGCAHCENYVNQRE